MQKAKLSNGCYFSSSQMLDIYPPLTSHCSTTENFNWLHTGEAYPQSAGVAKLQLQGCELGGESPRIDRDAAGQKK